MEALKLTDIIYLLEGVGGLVDLDVLLGLGEHPRPFEAVVETIKKLSP